MSTDTTTDQRDTTAEYANALFGDGTNPPTDPAGPSKPDNGKQGKTSESAKTGGTKKSPENTASESKTKAKNKVAKMVGTADGWIPADFAAVAPSSLYDAVTEHRTRFQAQSNISVKTLYVAYAVIAVPAGFALNVLSLAAAHTATALNEPERAREAGLGVVVLVIAVVALFWAL
ncbi:hypothetical protein FHX42_005247 [Saccharopolyspora lacisalsi]|uniref:Uncharacterized protein n=1 Tax=Halosaccharopolyspora lacisalsi TaxID=1000566 RepID=A0A839E475_9PSEU|nr:hypothetical protein [Halosaccharopolyspora lacisalsi]MBA8827840.1 hypothetical protein [Halosaccharopolyspora lacisalsi]